MTTTASTTAQDFLLATDAYEVVHDQEYRSEAVSVLDNDPMLPDGRLIVSVTREPAHGQLTMNPDDSFTTYRTQVISATILLNTS